MAVKLGLKTEGPIEYLFKEYLEALISTPNISTPFEWGETDDYYQNLPFGVGCVEMHNELYTVLISECKYIKLQPFVFFINADFSKEPF